MTAGSFPPHLLRKTSPGQGTTEPFGAEAGSSLKPGPCLLCFRLGFPEVPGAFLCGWYEAFAPLVGGSIFTGSITCAVEHFGMAAMVLHRITSTAAAATNSSLQLYFGGIGLFLFFFFIIIII